MSRKKDTPTAPPAPPMEKPAALVEIIDHVASLQAARGELGQFVKELNDALEALKADALPTLRVHVDAATAIWKGLEQRIAAHPELFVKPRTLRAHGIAFGFEKGKGALEFTDPDRTVELIRRRFSADEAALLLTTVVKPSKEGLEKLSAADLKALSVRIVNSEARVVIRPADGDSDKLVRSLVKAKVAEEES